MKTITFYSYKGGSGRTLLLANAARHLALAGKRVVALDLDFEAPGLHHKLYVGDSEHRNSLVVPHAGVVDYLLEALKGETAPDPAQFLISVPLPSRTAGELHLMPAGASPSAAYWMALTALSRTGRLTGNDDQAVVTALLELKARLEVDLNPDALLIDARTGITEFGGIATTLLADTVVCLLLDNSESLTGTRTVLRSFDRATRFHSQSPIEVVPVLSRIAEPNDTIRERILTFLNESPSEDGTALRLERLFFLRDDRDLAAEERLYVGEQDYWTSIDDNDGGRGIRGLGRRHQAPDMSVGLGKDYSDLLRAVFPNDDQDWQGPSALRRQEATYQMRHWLIEDEGESRRHRPTLPRAFRSDQVDEGVGLDRIGVSYADLVAYGPDGAPLVLALYSEELTPLKAWEWPKGGPRCVFLFNLDDRGGLQRRAFTRARKGQFAELIEPPDDSRSREWLLRLPSTYSALDDPGDQSIPAVVRSLHEGHDDFVGLLVREWQHASYLTLHGGTPYRPEVAKQIVDGLASVRDIEIGARILWQTAPDPFERTHEGLHEGAGLESLTNVSLHAPLFWRLPAAAKIQYWKSTRDRTSSAGLAMLARDVMGLRFDQDQDLRDDVRQVALSTGPIVSQPPADGESAELAYVWQDRRRELSFEVSDEVPPELTRRLMVQSLDVHGPRLLTWDDAEEHASRVISDARALNEVLRDRHGRPSLPTCNLLADYDPTTATVNLYERMLSWTAQTLDLPQRDIENVVLLHEVVHAVSHLGRDLDGRIWSDFAMPSPRELNFRPSRTHENLAQYFTHRLIEQLYDDGLQRAFDSLTDNQPLEYRAWRDMRSEPIEQVRRLLLRAREPLG